MQMLSVSEIQECNGGCPMLTSLFPKFYVVHLHPHAAVDPMVASLTWGPVVWEAAASAGKGCGCSQQVPTFGREGRDTVPRQQDNLKREHGFSSPKHTHKCKHKET